MLLETCGVKFRLQPNTVMEVTPHSYLQYTLIPDVICCMNS